MKDGSLDMYIIDDNGGDVEVESVSEFFLNMANLHCATRPSTRSVGHVNGEEVLAWWLFGKLHRYYGPARVATNNTNKPTYFIHGRGVW